MESRIRNNRNEFNRRERRGRKEETGQEAEKRQGLVRRAFSSSGREVWRQKDVSVFRSDSGVLPGWLRRADFLGSAPLV